VHVRKSLCPTVHVCFSGVSSYNEAYYYYYHIAYIVFIKGNEYRAVAHDT